MNAPAPDIAIRRFIVRAGLAGDGEKPLFMPLTGGVSSDIWLVETATRRFCVKRALPKLRVAADWHVDVGRSVFEAAWLKGAGRVVPEAVPVVLADDPAAGLLAMEYLPPEAFRWWKADLLAGRSDPAVAAMVGDRLARIHAGFARDPSARATFPRDDIFRAIRLDPYLEATGQVHPHLLAPLRALASRTAATKRTAIHGDVSPKNILVGPDGPVFLDAECAWFGDPAFDLAFCLNHLLLKCLASPEATAAHLQSFDALQGAYFTEVDWEDRADLETRAAALLPALFLARIDGKSPVEYISRETDREAVRRVAIPLVAEPVPGLADVRSAWGHELRTHLRGQEREH